MIEWNKVTWYSRLLALLLFLGVVPWLAFYIGTQYESAIQISARPAVGVASTPQAASTYETFLPGKILITTCSAGAEVGIFAPNHTIDMQYPLESAVSASQQDSHSLEQWQIKSDSLTLSKESTMTLLPQTVGSTTVLIDKEGIGSGGCGYIISDSFSTMDEYAQKYDTDSMLRADDLQSISFYRTLLEDRNHQIYK